MRERESLNLQNHILDTKELGDKICKKFNMKFPDEYLSIFTFEICRENFPAGIYVYSKWRKYYITEIDERGNMYSVLETDEFDDLFYNILDIQFDNMYIHVPTKKIESNIIRKMFVNCWLMRSFRCWKMNKNPDPRIKMFSQKIEWFSRFDYYYKQRAQREIDKILQKYPYSNNSVPRNR